MLKLVGHPTGAELKMCPLDTNRDARQLTGRCQVKRMPEKRLPAIQLIELYGKKGTRGGAGVRCDSVVEKLWKEKGGNQEEMVPVEKLGYIRQRVKCSIERRDR